ncbi:MAG TPA: CobD/CbiB family protein [Usitatibacter sp.]|nr:CobD/CbiB family protein [Usitatibacter sp.]
MSLLALLAALLAQYAYPVKGHPPLMAFYGRLSLSAAKRLNAGDRESGILAWFVLMGAVLIPVALLSALLASVHAFFPWLFDVAVLYATLRFLATCAQVAGIERALREGDGAAAATLLAQWQAEPLETEEPGSVARLTAEQALREAHQGTFALLFWFLALPGPLGLVLYPLALRAARTWAHLGEADERDFGRFAARAFHVIDWIPQRLSAFSFALVGDFEDALYCWRSQAAQWVDPDEGVVLASGAGALGVRLGEPIARGGAWVNRPVLGVGEPAREETLASLIGMLWRALILWMIVYLLAAALVSVA